MFERAAEIRRRIRLQQIAGGRERFIRLRLLQGLVTWIVWSMLMFVFKVFLFSRHEVVWISLITFPLWMLVSYLSSRWRWNELTKNQ